MRSEVVVKWHDWVAVVAPFIVLLAIFLKGGRSPVPLDPSKPYQVYCRDFDMEIEADSLDAVLGLERSSMSEERLARFGEDLAAWRVRHNVAAKETAARIRSTISQDVLTD